MDGYTLNAARTIREYESSIQRPKAERTINDSILSALLRGDELPEMDVKAIRQYGIQCSEYLDFGYDVDASLSGMLSPHAVLEPRPNTPYVFRRAGFDNLPFIYTQRHLRNAIAPKEADTDVTTSLHISRVLQTRKRSCISILRNMNKWKKSYPAMVGHDSLRRLQLFQWIL